MVKRLLRAWSIVGAVVGAAFLCSRAAAQTDRIIDTPTGWTYRYGASPAQISTDISNGLRPFAFERIGPDQYDVVTVVNSGPYAVSGFTSANMLYAQTPAALSTSLTGRRIIDLVAFELSGSTRLSAITVPNSGAGSVGWGWLYDTDIAGIANWLNTATPAVRLIDIEVYTVGGQRRYAAVGVNNQGSQFQNWWWYTNVTASEVSALLTSNNARLIDIEVETPGNVLNPTRYVCIMVAQNPGGGWWYPNLSSTQVGDLLAQNGARLTDIQRYTDFLGNTRYAVAMVDNANEQTRRMRGYIADSIGTNGAFGFRLKQVGGPVLASLNENFVYEPASSLKILHAAMAILRCSAGNDFLDASVFMRDVCNPNECPDNFTCNARNGELREVIRRTMENSDNNQTRELEERYGRGVLNLLAMVNGFGEVPINHTLGCLCGNEPNRSTAVWMTSFYERIADGTLFDASWRAELTTLMIDRLENGYGWFPTLSSLINQEAAQTNLTQAEISQFRTLVNIANKGGRYGCSGTLYKSEGAWVSIPFKQPILGGYLTVNRQYVLATFIHGTTLDEPSDVVYRAKEEILREQIREALQSWDAACTPPAITSHPMNRAVNVGEPVSFTVGNSGTAESRQWQRRQLITSPWVDVVNVPGSISGATTGTLTINAAAIANRGQYRLSITSVCGTATSNPAQLSVYCLADWDRSGLVTSGDVSAYLTDWFNDLLNGTTISNFDGDPAITSGDLSAFLSQWFNDLSGC